MDENIPWRSMDCLKSDTQCTQTGLAASVESLAVLQQRSVQMQTDVCLQRLWKSFQDLNKDPTTTKSETLMSYTDAPDVNDKPLLTAFMSMPFV